MAKWREIADSAAIMRGISGNAVRCVIAAIWTTACSAGAPGGERVAADTARVSASAVFIDGGPLAVGASIMLRVTGPSYAATLATGRGTLPAIASAGTYTISDTAGHAFGTFSVEAGAVVATSGVVTVGSAGLGFDTTRLARTTLATGTLTSPANLGVHHLVDVSTTFSGSPTFFLPAGTYAVSDPTGAHVVGGFTIASGSVTSTTGAASAVAGGIAFDRSKLASVSIPGTSLSFPSAVSVRLGADSISFGSATAFLADGTYTIGNDAMDRIYGSFDVSGHVVVAGHGGVVPSASGIAFDTTRLAVVTITTSTLTSLPTVQTVRVPNIGSALKFPVQGPLNPSVTVPPGDYAVTDVSGTKTYGHFVVTGTHVTSVTGALTITSTGVGFDNTKLATVVVPAPSGPGGIPLFVVDTTLPGGPTGVPTPSPTLHLPDGAYKATTALGKDYGTFVVSSRHVTSAEGGLAVDAVNGITFSSCELANVFMMSGLTNTTIAVPDISIAVPGGIPLTYRLPVGNFPLVVGGQTPSPFFINVPASGAITSKLPFTVCVPPQVPPSCGFFSATNATCRKPPRVSCVGTPSAPATITGVCNATVDNTNHLAGSCSDNGGGLATCTFDGGSSEALGTGTHVVNVVGTADDGGIATCTSFVRVTCTESPLVSCVGSSTSPLPLSTAPGVCELPSAGWAGTCDDRGDGVGSCTFDGRTDEVLAPGSYAVAVAGTSVDGASSSCTSYVTVTDNEPPQLTCDAPRTVECTGPTTPITTSATCSDNCGACSVSCPSGAYPLGTTSLACTGSDASANVASCSSSVTVVDTTPPSVSVSASPATLWPPDHRLVPIALSASAADACDVAPSTSCSAWSSEPPLALGSGHTDPDIVWLDGQLYLRAERSGVAASPDAVPGVSAARTYTIVCTSVDASGNEATATATVVVPHDKK